MITVVIIDDHPVVRAGLRTVLDAAEDVTVLATGHNGSDALELALDYHPDVLVLDVNLPDISGLKVTQQLSTRDDAPSILVLTVHDDRQTVFELLENGAQGYVLKDEALETLVDAVRAVAGDESWLSPKVASHVVDRATDQEPDPPESNPFSLTPRETEVLCLLAQGLDNGAIAERLVVTKRTVQNYVSTIYSKLDVDSRTQAALYAIRNGIVDVDSDVL